MESATDAHWLCSLVIKVLDSRLNNLMFDSGLLQLVLEWDVFGQADHFSISPSHLANSSSYP